MNVTGSLSILAISRSPAGDHGGQMFYVDDVDAELREHTEAQARIAGSLIELEQHPGHRLLVSGPVTGATAARWATVGPLLESLWRNFGRYRDALEAARKVRGTRARPGQDVLAEVHRLLTMPSVEVARTEVGLAERGLTGAAERVEIISLAELSGRMHEDFNEVSKFFITCAAVHEEAMAQLTSQMQRLQAAAQSARELDVSCPELGLLTSTLGDLERQASADPLSLAGAGIAGALAEVSAGLNGLGARLASIAEARDRWPQLLAELDAGLRMLDELREQELALRQRATEVVITSLTAPPDRLSDLLAMRTEVERQTPWPDRARAVERLRASIRSAAEQLRASAELASGLIERRAELRGRFEAYRARARRVGLIEKPELVALEAEIRKLLWTRPADLAGATRSVAAYQRLVGQVSDSGRPA